jgi:hypothetical protein
LKRSELRIFLLLSVIAVFFLTKFYYETTAIRHLDTVFLLESVDNLINGNGPVSSSVASWPSILPLLSSPPDVVCNKTYEFSDSIYFDLLTSHAYFILYPIAIFGWIFGSELIFALLNALSHFVLLVLPYFFLRRIGVGIVSSIAFLTCILLYPGWFASAQGDYYLDRFFMPLMLALLYEIYCNVCAKEISTKSSVRLYTIIPLAIVSASISERGAIMVIGSLAFFVVLFPPIRNNNKILPMLIGILLFLPCCLYFYYIYFHIGISGGSGLVLTPGQWLDRIQDKRMIPFFITNIVFLGWMVLFSGWRLILLVLGSMLPNFIVTIGGAELNGWYTHYHAMYIPFLIFGASVGYSKILEHLKKFRYSGVFPVFVATMAFTLYHGLGLFAAPFNINWGWEYNKSLHDTVFRFFAAPDRSGERVAVEKLKGLSAYIPLGSKISAVEGVMPVLYRGRKLGLYPYGIDGADYIVISGSVKNGELEQVTGAINHNGQIEQAQLNSCLHERIKSMGFVLVRDIPSLGILVFAKSGERF